MPEVVRLSRALSERPSPSDRLARIAALFTFVSHILDVPGDPGEIPEDGVDELLRLLGRQRGPAVVLAALLHAQGERVQLREVSGICFVQVEIEACDLSRLPPHARPVEKRGRIYLPLDPRRARNPLGFVPLWVRQRVIWRAC